MGNRVVGADLSHIGQLYGNLDPSVYPVPSRPHRCPEVRVRHIDGEGDFLLHPDIDVSLNHSLRVRNIQPYPMSARGDISDIQLPVLGSLPPEQIVTTTLPTTWKQRGFNPSKWATI